MILSMLISLILAQATPLLASPWAPLPQPRGSPGDGLMMDADTCEPRDATQAPGA